LLDQARRDSITYFPSPIDWRDEILYFLLPDRFSDGKENTRSLLTRQEINNFRNTPDRPDMNWADWSESGNRWQGGSIKGIEGKLDYLQQLGMTAIWIAPLYKQRTRKDTYHGYGIQDFLEVDPRFGSRRDLIELVGAAHDRGLKIIFDVIINHGGDNWGYIAPGAPLEQQTIHPWFKPFPNFYGNPNDADMRDWRTAWRNAEEVAFTTDANQLTALDDGVWPKELQSFLSYTRAGKGSLDDNELENDQAEHKRTDFFDLKDFALDMGGTLSFLCECFKYWIALTDCDGFRIDTVKHITLEEARNFCGAILEFSESIGKRNFLLVGEIAGGDANQDFVMDYSAQVKRNLKAALDIGSDRIILTQVGKGLQKAEDYFKGFAERTEGFDSHRSFGDRHISILNDHDHVFGEKSRFSADIPDDSAIKDYQVIIPTAIQLFTLGIPCIYYGSEQAFSGPAQLQVEWIPHWRTSDRYLRETMFGGEHPRQHHDNDMNTQLNSFDTSLPGFAAFGITGKHVFDTGSPSFIRIAALCQVRSAHLILRVGRQYYREVRFSGGFRFPETGELIAWSRILDFQEAVCVLNAGNNGQNGDVVVDSTLWEVGTAFTVVANTAQTSAEANGQPYTGSHRIGSTTMVRRDATNEPAFLELRGIAPAEVVILIKLYQF
jgi:glycosidase